MTRKESTDERLNSRRENTKENWRVKTKTIKNFRIIRLLKRKINKKKSGKTMIK